MSSDDLGYGRWGAPWFLLTAPCLTCFANYHTCWLFFAGFCRLYGFYNGCGLMDSRYHPYGHLIDAYLTRPFLCPEWPWEQWPSSRFRCQLIAQYTKWWWSTIKYMLWENFCNILCSQFTLTLHDKNLIFFHIENAAHFVLLLVCCLGEFQNMNFCCKNCCVLAVECRRWIQISSALKCLAVKDSACLGFPWQPVAFCTSDKGCLWRIGFYVNDIWIFFVKVQFFYLICLQNIRVLQ